MISEAIIISFGAIFVIAIIGVIVSRWSEIVRGQEIAIQSRRSP